MTALAKFKAQREVSSRSSTPYADSQAMIKDMPVLFKGLYAQMKDINKLTREHLESHRRTSDSDSRMLERIHDRLDSVVVESRVTNMLLCQLVAIQESVISTNVDNIAEAVRAEVYNAILNGE